MTRVLLTLLAACLLFGGVQTWRLDRVKTELHDANQLNETYRKAFKAAKDDAQTQADQCLARVNEARQSARRIETIIERPTHVDPQGCAVRELVPAGELRDALQPSGPAAQPLH